jgi:signal transduction histidine kinase
MRGWSSASIRARLTAWYTAVLFLMMAIYASVTFLAVRHEFYEQLEDQPHVASSELYSEAHVQEQLREVLVVLVLGLPLVVALAAAGGYMLAGRALVPVETSFNQLRRFTADASHELRTPLSVIRGIGEAGLRETRTPAEYKEAIGSMLEEVDRLTSLVDALLRLSYADAGTVVLSTERLDLGQLARDVTASLGVLADERSQRFALDLPAGVSVSADRLVLREAVTNVIDNAIKHSPRGSSIQVDVRADGSQALLTVTDEGPGVPVEYRSRVFDRFFRIDEGRSRDDGGTGLGLAIAKWAVEANGGHLSVDAGPRGGSAFRIALPVKGDQV